MEDIFTFVFSLILARDKTRKHHLWIHYNPDSSGSFVDKIISQYLYFQEEFKITFVFPRKGEFTEKLVSLGARVIYREMTENNSLLTYFFSFFTFVNFLKKEKIDLIYFLDFVWWKPAEILSIKILRIPCVGFIGFYKTKEALKGFISKLNMIVANSNATRKSLIENGLEERSCVINNFIDLDKYEASKSIRDKLCEEFRVDKKFKIVGYLGALHPIKGIENLLNAFSDLLAERPQTHLFIVGYEKEEGYRKELERIVQDLNIGSYVTFLGKRSDVGELIKSFDVLVVPSLDEPFGYVLIEAGACEVPVVASNVGGIPEVVLHEETGLLFEKENEEELLACLVKVLDNPDFAKNLSLAAYKRTKENFSKVVILEKWKELFKNFSE